MNTSLYKRAIVACLISAIAVGVNATTDVCTNYQFCLYQQDLLPGAQVTDPIALDIINKNIHSTIVDAPTKLYIKYRAGKIKKSALYKHSDCTEGLRYFVSYGVKGFPESAESNEDAMRRANGFKTPCKGDGAPAKKKVVAEQKLRALAGDRGHMIAALRGDSGLTSFVDSILS